MDRDVVHVFRRKEHNILKIDYITRDPPQHSDKNYSPVESFVLYSRPENRAKKKRLMV